MNKQMSLFSNESSNFVFRPIHYLGSKLRILDFIKETIDTIDNHNGRVCDLFSGSGTVSYYLSESRPVTSVDIQEYSRVLNSALLKSNISNIGMEEFISQVKNSKHYEKMMFCFKPLIKYEESCIEKALLNNLHPLANLIENGSILAFEKDEKKEYTNGLKSALEEVNYRLRENDFIDGPEALISRYYGGLYFSYSQSVEIDIILEFISRINKQENKDFYLAVLLSTVSDIVNTVGKQFAQPLKAVNSNGKPKKNIINKVKKDRDYDVLKLYSSWFNNYISLPRSDFNHEVYRMDYSDALNEMENISLVYADPPYTRYHYSRYYHVLETLCLRDNPSVTKIKKNGKKVLTRGVYRNDRHQSPFSIKSKSEKAFNKLFKQVNSLNADLILSYSPQENTPRVKSIDNITSIASNYFKDIEVVKNDDIFHSKLNNKENNTKVSYNAELLIIGQN